LNKKSFQWPSYSDNEIKVVSEILKSGKVNYWTGSWGQKFEKNFADLVGASYSIALSNGTVALELAIESLQLKEGMEILLSPRSFFASVSAIVRAGLKPVFVDVDLDSGNILPEKIVEKITNKTAAIMTIHISGWPSEMKEILQICKENNLFLIEDCAQAHGACYQNKSVGSFGDISAWSFCQDKIISTGGEGGAITTNCSDLYERAWSIKDHGKKREDFVNRKFSCSHRFIHHSFGTNYRMTEIQSAIGFIQLGFLKDWNNKRKLIANQIFETAKQYSLFRVPEIPGYIQHAFYRAVIYLRPERLKESWNIEKVCTFLNSKVNLFSRGPCPEMYLEPAFSKDYRLLESLPNAKQLGQTTIMVLINPNLSDKDISSIKNAIHQLAEQATT